MVQVSPYHRNWFVLHLFISIFSFWGYHLKNQPSMYIPPPVFWKPIFDPFFNLLSFVNLPSRFVKSSPGPFYQIRIPRSPASQLQTQSIQLGIFCLGKVRTLEGTRKHGRSPFTGSLEHHRLKNAIFFGGYGFVRSLEGFHSLPSTPMIFGGSDFWSPGMMVFSEWGAIQNPRILQITGESLIGGA